MAKKIVTGRGHLRAGPAKVADPPPSEGFAIAAAHLEGGMEFLNTDSVGDNTYALWTYTFVAGFVVEAKLKAFLADCGVTVKELRKIGHNLEGLWVEARAHGLGATTDAPVWMQRLNELHSNFELRYRQESRGVVFVAKPVLEEGLEELTQMLGIAVAKRKAP